MTTYTGAYTGAEHDLYLGYVKDYLTPYRTYMTYLTGLAGYPVDTSTDQSIAGIKTFTDLTASRLLRLNASKQLVSSSYDEIDPATLPLLAATANNFTAEVPLRFSHTALTHDGIIYMNDVHDIRVSSDITHESLKESIGRVVVKKLDCSDDPVATITWSEANVTPQVLEFNNALPAMSKLMWAFVKCTTTVGNSVSMNLNVYLAAPEDLIAEDSCHVENEFLESSATLINAVSTSGSARSVYIALTPAANWNTCSSTGNWELYLAYYTFE